MLTGAASSRRTFINSNLSTARNCWLCPKLLFGVENAEQLFCENTLVHMCSVGSCQRTKAHEKVLLSPLTPSHPQRSTSSLNTLVPIPHPTKEENSIHTTLNPKPLVLPLRPLKREAATRSQPREMTKSTVAIICLAGHLQGCYTKLYGSLREQRVFGVLIIRILLFGVIQSYILGADMVAFTIRIGY